MSWLSSLKGKVFIVTGAGKGLGRAYALYLAAHGAAIVVNNRWRDKEQPSSADQLAEEITKAGGQAASSQHDVEDAGSGDSMVSLALNRFGRLDGLIANAGVPEAASFARKPLADFRAVFDINFFGTLYVVHAAWKILLSQKSGRVVLSTSAAGLHGNRGMAAYSASKAALIGLMRALALEGGNANVNINAIAPYATTAMTENYIDKSTAQRMKPESVAPIAAWLVSESCNVTGQTFITGANRLRRGYAVEGPLIAIGDDVGRAIHQASRVGTAQAFAHANEAFQVFLSQEPSL